MQQASQHGSNGVGVCLPCDAATGLVEGVLWYFPYQNDQETVPLDPHTLSRMQLATTNATQGPGGGLGGGSLFMQQHGALPTQYAAAKDAQLQAPGAAHGVIKEAGQLACTSSAWCACKCL
jgi:hypothetical protein